MDQLTETQLQELEFQFDEGDREEFDRIAGTFGWSEDIIDRVWSWLQTGEHATESRGSGEL